MKRFPFSAPARDRLDWLGQIGYVSVQLFLRNELANHAAAISFYFLLSIVPIVLLMLYAANLLTQLPQLAANMPLLFVALWDQLNLGALKALGALPEQTRAVASGASLLTLVMASRGLLNALQSAFRVIFAGGKRSFWQAWLVSLLAMPLAFGLIVLAIVAQRVLAYLSRMGLLGQHLAAYLGLAGVVTFLVLWLLIFTAYWRMPIPRPPRKVAALVSLLCALSILALKAGFGYFVRLDNYQAIYGTLGTVVFSLIWVYIVAVIFLAWAQCLYALGRLDVLGLEKLFLASSGKQTTLADRFLFGHSQRLLRKYGQTIAAGTTIIREGETSQLTYFLQSGQVTLYKDVQGRAVKIAGLQAGEIFGEMAYLLGESRTATVIADSDVFLVAFPPQVLEELMATSPALAREIIGALAQRLKQMNQAQIA
ncbi:MAG TPA: YhjD/YihY/BrkB family envelope integrity protein [Sulfuriferula sp.]|nr:YhjD/YihY/BrkB family envelope integrity protein [Sulfuriferula sp.]